MQADNSITLRHGKACRQKWLKGSGVIVEEELRNEYMINEGPATRSCLQDKG